MNKLSASRPCSSFASPCGSTAPLRLFTYLTLLTLLTLSPLALRAQDGAWIFGTNVYLNGLPSAGETISFEPLTNRCVRADGSLARTYRIDIVTDEHGSIGSNFLFGIPYRVVTPDQPDFYRMVVPRDGLAHDWVTLGDGPFNYGSSNYSGGFIALVRLNGTNLGSRSIINFLGSGLKGTNNPLSNSLDIVLPEGGGSGSGNILSINGDTAADQTMTLSHSGNTPAIVDSTPDHLFRFPFAGTGTNGLLHSNHFTRFFAHGAQIGGNSNAIATIQGMSNSWVTFAVHSVVTQAFDARLVSLESSRTSLELMTNALGTRVSNIEGMSNQFVKVAQSNAFALASMTNLWAPRRVTNYAYASSIAINTSTDVSANGTNPVSGNVSLLLTNGTVGTSGNYTATSDGSARTYSVFSDKPIAMLSTNETVNSTQLVTTANKLISINWAIKQTNNVAYYVIWAKSQP